MYAGFEQSFVERMARQEEVLLGQALKGTGAGGLDLVAVEQAGQEKIAVKRHALVQFSAVLECVCGRTQGTESCG